MRKLWILWMLVLMYQGVLGQNPYNGFQRAAYNEAILDFFEGDYMRAHSIFKHLFPIDTSFGELNYYLGASLLNVRGKEDSAMFHLKLAVSDSVGEALFWIGKAYHIEHDFDQAIHYYKKYQNLKEREISTHEILRHIEISKRASHMVSHPVDLQIDNLGSAINSKFADYGPLVNADHTELLYTSRRQIDPGLDSSMEENYFEDIYFAEAIEGEWMKGISVGTPLNTETHDATVSLASSGNDLILYRTNKNRYGGDLYLSQRNPEGWGEPQLLTSRINSNYQEASAMIDPSGNTMYFSSNRPGGYGGKDLYTCVRLPNGKWSLPTLMGPEINTQYDEDSPFIQADGTTLYFASNGHNTMGGYDIFKTRLTDNGTWTLPENMGYPLNTVKDDIYFMMCPDCQTGYYAADLEGGYGSHDIYKVYFPVVDRNIVVVKGKIRDSETGNGIKTQIVLFETGYEDKMKYYQSNANTGRFILIIEPDRSYQLYIEAEGYAPQQKEILVNDDPLNEMQEIEEEFSLEPIFEHE